MKSNSNAFNKFFLKYQCRLFCFCDSGSHVAQACFKLANCLLILGARIPGMCCYADVLRFFSPLSLEYNLVHVGESFYH